jgi:long-chain acyl-CoA synthetase
MRDHLATLLHDFRRYDRQIAVVRHLGNRRKATSYGELARLAGRFAALLARKGIQPGDRVVLWAENSAEWIAAFYGCMARGVLVVPLDAYGSVDFAARVSADVTPKLVVGDGHLLRQLGPEWPQLNFDGWPGALPDEEAEPVAGLGAKTPLQILFTSGTTGDPKGIVHTHGNVLASVRPIEDGARPYLRYERAVHPLRFLHTLPLSHVFGQMMGLWVPPIFAAEVHFESRLVAPRLVETIRRERISVLAAVPRVHALLKTHLESAYPGLTEQIAASEGIRAWKRWWRFRKIHSAFGFKFWALISGGGALTGPVEHFWNSLGFVVVQGYGMTETTALITLNHPFHVARGSIGKPLPGRDVKIGADGELLVRGPMISNATWAGGAIRQREDEWLATGDLAEAQTSGELKFLGRKSEVIVTASGVNIHPEDLEAVIEQQAGVTACAVVPMETPTGPEACAVLACRAGEAQAGAVIQLANARLADFQQVRRWMLWPEPDLPRTSTGKVRRKAVAAWLAARQASALAGASTAAASDWLVSLIAQISGEMPSGSGDEMRLSEDLHLDSLGRVQLAAAIEDKLGSVTGAGMLDGVETLGALRTLLAGSGAVAGGPEVAAGGAPATGVAAASAEPVDAPTPLAFPGWPFSKPVAWVRVAFIEAVMRPLVRFLAAPRLAPRGELAGLPPLLIVANHVTAYDGPLVQYALPGAMRRRLAVAMSGEMLEDYRRFRNPENGRFMLLGPLAYFLITALFNVFPLARRRDFQASFAHAGRALDRGYNVLVFPEGTRSADGTLARFRGGIGMLVKNSGAAVLPVAIRGLGTLKTGKKGWFRSGDIEVRVGEPVRFGEEETEAGIAARLQEEVRALLTR